MIYRRWFTQVLPRIYPKYALFWRFTFYLPKIYPKFTKDLLMIYKRFGIYLLNFIQDLPKIYRISLLEPSNKEIPRYSV